MSVKKAIITKQQARDLADILKTTKKKRILEIATSEKSFFAYHPSLAELNIEELAIALYVGFKIEKASPEEELVALHNELKYRFENVLKSSDSLSIREKWQTLDDMKRIKETLAAVGIVIDS